MINSARRAALLAGTAVTAGLVALTVSALPAGAARGNAKPSVPSEVSVDSRTAASSPVLVGSVTPTLRAKIYDADNESALTGRFRVAKIDVATGSELAEVGTFDVTSLPSGSIAALTLPALEDRGVYRFEVRAIDRQGMRSAWSDSMTFSIDATGPQVAPKVSSSVYGDDLNEIYGSVGRTADFTFDPAGESDIVGFKWGWTDPPTTDAPGAPATLALTPPSPSPSDPSRGGQLILHVASVDAVGRMSPVTNYAFNIGGASSPNAQWNLDDPAGAANAADASGNGFDAVVEGASAGTPGRILDGPGQAAPTAFAFDGVDDQIVVGRPVIDTSGSFAVSAWVKLATKERSQAVLGQGPLALGYSREADRWTFTTGQQDTASANAPAIGVWTHLAVVHDKQTGTTDLYVNGAKEGTTVGAVPSSTDALTIGRGLPERWFAGEVATVKVWDRVAYPSEFTNSTLVARWRLAGDGSDAVAFGRDLAAIGPVVWSDERDGSAAFGGDAALATEAAAVRTDQSFTLAAWAKLAVAAPQGDYTLASQIDPNGSGVKLIYRDGAWRFIVQQAGTEVAAAVAEAPAGDWTYVAAVYDAASGQLKLYVAGELRATAEHRIQLDASGPLQIGRNVDKDYWIGGVDDVRAYYGILAASKIWDYAQLG